jgi:hypothetical protein
MRELESHLRHIDDTIAHCQAVAAGDSERAASLHRRLACHLRGAS